MERSIELTVNDDHSLTVPAELFDALIPGVHLVVENKSTGSILLRISTPVEKQERSNSEDGPRLVERDGLLVIEGNIEEGFDWDAFHHQYREAATHDWNDLEAS